MSTRSIIGYFEDVETFKVKATYCHHDGYPTGVGSRLYEIVRENYTGSRLPELIARNSYNTTMDFSKALALPAHTIYLKEFMKDLVDDNPWGWSTLGSDWLLGPHWIDYSDVAKLERQLEIINYLSEVILSKQEKRGLNKKAEQFYRIYIEDRSDFDYQGYESKSLEELKEAQARVSFDFDALIYLYRNAPLSYKVRPGEGEQWHPNMKHQDASWSMDQEWAYFFDIDKDKMHVYQVFERQRPKAIGKNKCIRVEHEPGYYIYYMLVAIVDLHKQEPDWEAMESVPFRDWLKDGETAKERAAKRKAWKPFDNSDAEDKIDVDHDEVKMQYRAVARAIHPDTLGSEATLEERQRATFLMQRLNAAYDQRGTAWAQQLIAEMYEQYVATVDKSF